MPVHEFQPLVTIVIPSYNHALFVQDAIKSIINQSYENIELIVIDDGSSDNSVYVVNELLEQCQLRFKRFEFRVRPNRGLSNTLNEGLEWARGEYFSVLASDDQMLPEKTKLQVSSFKPDTVGVFGGVNIINNKNEIISFRVREYSETSFEDIILNKHDLPASSQMFKTALLREAGGYNPNVKVEDWDLLLRISKLNKKLVYIPHILISYRLHDTNLGANEELMYNEMMKILAEYKDNKLYPVAWYWLQKRYKLGPIKKSSKLKYYILKYKFLIYYYFSYFKVNLSM